MIKLIESGTRRKVVEWLASYLTGRWQNVRLNGQISRDIIVHSGVPQGSHLGPLLFILFLNDLCDKLKDCFYLLYADDLKIFKVIRGVEDAMVLQENIVNVYDWCYENDMFLNVSKCKFVSFSRRRIRPTIQFNYDIQETVFEKCSIMNDLGIINNAR